MDGLIEGRVVHFVMPDGQHRPASVVRVWDKEAGYVNLQVMLDGTNDGQRERPNPEQGFPWPSEEECLRGVMWRTSVYPDQEERRPGTWHWIERA